MHILQEDQNKLNFKIYPPKYLPLFAFFIIFVLLYGMFHHLHAALPSPEAIILIVLILSILILSYAYPIHVLIDKRTNTLTYQSLVVFSPTFNDSYKPNTSFQRGSFFTTITIPIDGLQSIGYSTDTPELDAFTNRITTIQGKYTFALKHDTIAIYAGIFSTIAHRQACMKIADFLKVPYRNSWDNKKEEIQQTEKA